jgi:fused signal recognition particle receptor
LFDKLKNALHKFEESITHRIISQKDIQDAITELESDLYESEVAFEAVQHIETSLRQKLIGLKVERGQTTQTLVHSTIRETILNLLETVRPMQLETSIRSRERKDSPYTILFLGINGTGKTTTIAKIAHLLAKGGFKVLLAAADTYRAGAIEQLETHAQRIGVKILKQRYGADPAAVARDAKIYGKQHGYDVVLVDTAGRMQTSRNLMEELAKVKRVASPDITIFVGDSLAGNDLISQAKEFLDMVGFEAIVLTKIDADVKGGAAVSVIYATQRPILYLGTGQSYDDLRLFESSWIINRILG